MACERRDVDRHSRIVAVCRAGFEDANGRMVAQGWALAFDSQAAS
jgi:endonuclease YncB( thermonuclease family)